MKRIARRLFLAGSAGALVSAPLLAAQQQPLDPERSAAQFIKPETQRAIDRGLAWLFDFTGDELFEVVAFLVALESRVQITLLREAANWMNLPLRNVFVRNEQSIGVDVHAILRPTAQGPLRDVVRFASYF